MKPTKNLYYCCDCGRTKMLFETEKKALTFIRFNAEEIASRNADGKAPARAYYCVACLGWHTSSSLEPPTHSSRAERYLRSLTKGNIEEVPDKMTRKLLRHDAELQARVEKRKEKKRKLAEMQAKQEKDQQLRQEQQKQAALAQATHEYHCAMDHYDRAKGYLQQMAIYEACGELAAGIKQLQTILHSSYKQLCTDKMAYGYALLEQVLDTWCDGIVGRIDAGSLEVAEGYLEDYRRTLIKLYGKHIRKVADICGAHWGNCAELEKKIDTLRRYRQSRWA